MTTTYFGCTVTVWRRAEEWHPYPWLFNVTEPNGVTHEFRGIPNLCETKASALRGAWWRAKWLADGTFHSRYRVPTVEVKT